MDEHLKAGSKERFSYEGSSDVKKTLFRTLVVYTSEVSPPVSAAQPFYFKHEVLHDLAIHTPKELETKYIKLH